MISPNSKIQYAIMIAIFLASLFWSIRLPASAAYANFTRNLGQGASGEDVRELQLCLKSDPAIYPEGLVTGYFGSLTKAAVTRFQEKYTDEILSPFGLIKGNGFVGPKTRAKLNTLCGIPLKLNQIEEPKPETRSEPEVDAVDPCVGITCSECHYCVTGKCVVRADGYNDCGDGCQRCVSGRCKDYNSACDTFSFYCENDQCKLKLVEILKPVIPEFKPIEIPNICVNCLGADNSCGCISCTDCNKSDGWFDVGKPYISDWGPGGGYFNQKQEYRDYFCSGTFCGYKITKTQTKRIWIKDSSSPLCPGIGLPEDFGKIYPLEPGTRIDPGPIIPFK